MSKILFNHNLFIQDSFSCRNWVTNSWDKHTLFRLKETNFCYDDATHSWLRKVEYTVQSISFENLFLEIIEGDWVSDKTKELILFNLVDLRKLGRK